jgi:hypothetical protein
MARGQSRSQSELRSAGPDKGPNKGLDKEQAEAFNTLTEKQKADAWVGTDILLKKLNPNERANFMAHLEAEDERFMDTYDSTLDENGEQTDDDFDRQQALRVEAEQGAVQRFFEGQTQYSAFGRLGEQGVRATADQKIILDTFKKAKVSGMELTNFRIREDMAENVAMVNDRMDSITVAEYTRISDAGTVDLMKHDTYDKWMRSSTGGKEFVKEVKASAANAIFKNVLATGDRPYKVAAEDADKVAKLLKAADNYDRGNR